MAQGSAAQRASAAADGRHRPLSRQPSTPSAIAAGRDCGCSRARRCCSSAARAASARRRSPRRSRCGWRARIAARRVLLLSTDPAHSLGDVFDAPVGDTRAHDSRRAAEPACARARCRRGARRAARASSKRRSTRSRRRSAIDGRRRGDRRGRELMDLAPPGIDELFGMLSVVDARAAYDVIVVDTAPTGHALRLLEMPDAAREWVQVLLRVLLKYRSLVRPGPAGGGARRGVEVDPRAASRCCAIASDDALHRRDARGRAAAPRNRAAADAPAPPASVGAGGRRQRADAGAGPLRALPRRRGRRTARARAAAARAAGRAVRYHPDPAGRRRRRAASRRSNAGRGRGRWNSSNPEHGERLKCRWPKRHLRLLRGCRRSPAAAAARAAPACPAQGRSACSTSSRGCSSPSPTRRSTGTAKTAINAGWRSRLGVARRGRARSGRRVVHRVDRGAADEAVHDLHDRRARARARARRSARGSRRWSSAWRISRSGASGSCSIARCAARPRRNEAQRRGVGTRRRPTWRRRRRSATPSKRAGVARPRDRRRAVRSAGGARRATRSAASASELPAQGGPLLLDAAFLVPRARAATFKALAARESQALARQGYGLTLSGPWPPYTFVQD